MLYNAIYNDIFLESVKRSYKRLLKALKKIAIPRTMKNKRNQGDDVYMRARTR